MDRTSLIEAALALEAAFPVLCALMLAVNSMLDFKVRAAAPGA